LQSYTVYEPPKPAPNRLARAERFVFVRDGFSWTAALLAPLWMLFNRMWLLLILYLVLVAGLNFAMAAAEIGPQWSTIAMIALHLAIGFEAGTLRHWAMHRRRWRVVGSVVGHSRLECERQFFESWLAQVDREDKEERPEPPRPAPRQTTSDQPGPMVEPGPGPVASGVS